MKWSFCGGGMVIIASNFQEAQFLESTEKLFEKEEDIPEDTRFHCWVLVSSLNLNPVDQEDSRSLLCDYNWG